MAQKLFGWDATNWRLFRFGWVYEAGSWQPLVGAWGYDGAAWRRGYPPVAGALASIVVSPSSVVLSDTQTQQFTATGYDSDGLVVVISPTWTNSDHSNTIDSSGFYTAGSNPGDDPVYATVGAISGTATAHVT